MTTFAIISAILAAVALVLIVGFLIWEKRGGPHG
jgi:hypothetical protein